MNEQIKTYILTTVGGGIKYKNYLYSRPFWGEKIQKLYFHDHFFSLGGGGGGRNKVLTFLLKKTAVKMTVCLARFRRKCSLLFCEIRNIDHVCVYHGISFIQSKTTISIMETCTYSYVYLSISNIYLSVCMYACIYVCVYAYMYLFMYVCMYVFICLSVCTRISIYLLFSLPQKWT